MTKIERKQWQLIVWVSTILTHDSDIVYTDTAASKNATDKEAHQLHSSEEETTPGGEMKQELVVATGLLASVMLSWSFLIWLLLLPMWLLDIA